MQEPTASRPYMPGYGIVAADEGKGLLPWSWAAERLASSHDYWLATVRPDGQPHVLPVWAVFQDGALWFSSSLQARKARNLAVNPRCALTTDDPLQPVVIEGTAALIGERATVADFAGWVNDKYETSYSEEFFDPATNACFRVEPSWVFALDSEDFTGTPTRWRFATP